VKAYQARYCKWMSGHSFSGKELLKLDE